MDRADTPTPKLKLVTGKSTPAAPERDPPEHLHPEYRAYWADLREQVRIAHSAVTPATESLIVSAAVAFQNEQLARQWAEQSALLGDSTEYLKFSSEARAEGRALRSALGALRLSGDRSAASSKTVTREVAFGETRTSGRWK